VSMFDGLKAWWSKTSPLQPLPATAWSAQPPTFTEAQPAVIDGAVRRSQRRPSGNWYVFAASTEIGRRPYGTSVGGREIVAWRGAGGELHTGPGACPHLGADLSTGTVDCNTLICPWHGLRLDGARRPGWTPYPAYDDGVLAWVRLDDLGGEPPSEAPVVPARPGGPCMHAVARVVGRCQPRDVVANRFDPWHGAWLHPYSFTRLQVLSSPAPDADLPEQSDRFLVAVTFRIARVGVPVVAEFTSPEPRTVVMRILDGEGAGSVVETHATPMGLGSDGVPRTAVLEAVVAHSDRPGFARAVRAAPLLAPLIRHAAARLWRDDMAYAERRYWLRTRRT
jgi:hypothetical protein